MDRSGNSYKSMVGSLEASLKKLQTPYVDILCTSPVCPSNELTFERRALVGL